MKSRILLAMRPSLARQDYEAGLRRNGFDVSVAADGLASAALIRRFRPDTVVLEAELLWGGADGVLALLHELFVEEQPAAGAAVRPGSGSQAVPVLVVTSDNHRSTIFQLARFSISDFLVSPISVAKLVGRVRQLVAAVPAIPAIPAMGEGTALAPEWQAS